VSSRPCAGIHNPRPLLLKFVVRPSHRKTTAAAYGSRRSPGRRWRGRQHMANHPRTRFRVRALFVTALETEGAGKAGCRSHSWSACERMHAAEPQVRAEHPAFPARWLYGLYVISPGTGVLAPVVERNAQALSLNLTSAPGGQDHTISPCASCCSSARLLTLQPRYAHRIPHSTSVTVAKRPSCEAGRRDHSINFRKTEAKYRAGGLNW
jgi:hypothetical protein